MATMTGGATESADAKLWRERMGDKGWGTPTWPKPTAAAGFRAARPACWPRRWPRSAPATRSAAWASRCSARPCSSTAPRSRSRSTCRRSPAASLRWCQGYSEPGAGSDLASPADPGEDKGDHWLVNGQKIWTSGAQFADWCYCLVRTDPKAKKHEGISFLMIDMNSPGVEVRPILLINGTSPFCETFFTDVKVPKENQWGPLNGGWTVGKRLLQFERDSISTGLGGGNLGAAGRGDGRRGLRQELRRPGR